MPGISVRSRSVGIVAVTALLLVVAGQKAAVATTLPPQLQNQGSGKCLAVAGGSFNDNAVLVQYNCDGNSTRRWTVPVTLFATGTIRNGGTGKCATPGGQGLNTNGWHLVQFTCDGEIHRSWQLYTVTTDFVWGQFRNAGSGYCMGIDGNSGANNAIVVQQTCDTTNPYQFWKRIP